MNFKLFELLAIFFLLLVFSSNNIFAQNTNDSYIFPIKTKAGQAYLAGNMGEIRGQHFHLGLDIGAMTGTEVMAVADGYVAYAEVSPVSYGKLLMIYHPTTDQKTVYAHLDGFAGDIADFIRKTQFSTQKTEVKIDFLKEITNGKILVKKGQIIGYVGNTGISGGAHLHFEIREKNDVALNPINFNFQEVPRDNLPPTIKKIAITPLNIEGRVEGEFLRHTFIPEKISRGLYRMQNPIKITGEIGLEVFAEDIIPNSQHTFSIQKIELFLGGNEQKTKYWVCDLQKIDNAKNRMMLMHINSTPNSKDIFQKCYTTDGNTLENYPIQKNKGKINLKADEKMPFTLALTDAWGNQSILEGIFIGEKPQKNAILTKKETSTENKADADTQKTQENQNPEILYEIHENLLKISTKNFKYLPEDGFLTFKGMRQNVRKAYQLNQNAVYLWDMRDGLPDGIEIGEIRTPLYFRKTIYPTQKSDKGENIYELSFLADEENTKLYDKIRVKFNENSLFDTLYFELKPLSNGFIVGNMDIYLWNNINIQYFLANDNFINEKYLFYLNNTQAVRTKIVQKNIFSFDTRRFGAYYLSEDNSPPSVKLISKNPRYVQLQTEDTVNKLPFGSGIALYQATIDGKFALLEYEPKENKLFIRQPQKEPALSGNLEVKVTDLAGNEEVLKVVL